MLFKPLIIDRQVYGIAGAAANNNSVWVQEKGSFFSDIVDDLTLAISKIKHSYDLSRLFEDAPEGYVMLDNKLHILAVNPAFCEIIGIDESEVIGINGIQLARKLFTGKALKTILLAAKQLLKGGSDLPFEVNHGDKVLSVSTNFRKLSQARITVVRDVTALKKIEQGIRNNEDKFRNLVNALRDSVFILQDGVIKFVNQTLCKVSGYSEQELIGANFTLFVAPEEIEKVVTFHASRVLGKDAPTTYESVAITRSGKRIPVETTIIPVEYGNKPAWQVVLQDISDYKNAISKLMESESRFRFLTQSTFEGIVSHINGIIQDCNESFLRITGYSREETIGANIFDYIPREDDRKNILTKFSQNYVEPYMIHALKKDGTIMMAEIEGKKVEFRGQEMRIVAVRDITERFILQEKVKESTRKLETLLGNLPGMAYTCHHSPLWDMTYLSAGCFDLLEYKPEEIMHGQPVSYGNLIHPEDADFAWKSVQKAVGLNKPFQIEYRVKTKSGKEKWVWEKGKLVMIDEQPFIEGFIIDISKRKQAEKMLSNSNHDLKKAQELGQMGSWSINLKTKKVSASDQAYAIYGFDKRPEITWADIKTIPLPQYRQILDTSLQNLIHNNNPYDVEFKIKNKKSGLIHDIHSIAEYDPGTETVSGIIQDITHKKQAEEKLNQTLTELRYGQKLAGLGSWGIDLNKNIVTTSEQTRLMYGFDPCKKITPEMVQQIHQPEYRQHLEKALLNLIQGKTGYDETFELKNRQTGEILTVRSIAEYNPQTNRITGVIQNITNITKAEKEIKTMATNLSHIFNVTHDTICILDFNSRIIDINQTFIDRMEYSRKELLGQPIQIIDPWATQEVVDNLIADLRKQRSLQTFESNHVTKSGRTFPVEIHSKIINYNGEEAILSTSRDISERKKAEKTLKEYKEQLEQTVKLRTEALQLSNKEMEAFIYSVSHDLRAPLRAINGYTGMFQERYKNKIDEDGNRLLNLVRSNSNQMALLITELLNLSRMARAQLRYVEIDMEKLFRDVYLEITSPAEQNQFEFVLHRLPRIPGDVIYIKQLIANLLGNSVKYSAKSENKKIEVGVAESSPDAVTYFVKDQGAGFNPAYKNKLFEIFQRLHSDSEFSGTGVGLAIASRIINKHNGKIWGEGEKEKGATFFFTLPRNQNNNGLIEK
ncbi:MAG: PAS domain S-box protein [Bacteroidales bacterium]|nr:PAS domain S-box protein [Bacteroidales bacterium]